MTATKPVIASEPTDSSLCLIIDAVEASPPRPGGGVEVTLYLPGAAVMGSIEPCWYFDQQVLFYLQSIGVNHRRDGSDSHTSPEKHEPGAHSHEYVHLSHATYRLTGGEEDHHEQIRVRLADISAWTFGRGAHNLRERLV